MPSNLERLASRVHCPRCTAAAWRVASDGLECRHCGAAYPRENGVLVMPAAREDADIARERTAARETEHDPSLGGINDTFDDLSRAEGPLRDALLALPCGDGSRYYGEPGYFRNVQSAVAGVNFILRHLVSTPGERLLDLGADLTWSTCLFARRGFDCTAVDINHHLAIAELFERHYGVSYDCVQTDMTSAPFNDQAFDVVVGIDALHHSGRLDALAANIARMLTPGGRLAIVEPYCRTEEEKATFGRDQIGAGIGEHVYLLDEWHRAFTRAGLAIRHHRVAESFAAIYERPRDRGAVDSARPGDREDLFAGFYDARLTALMQTAAIVRPGSTLDVLVRVDNLGPHTWCSNSQFLVRACYHLFRDGNVVAWDHPRTDLPLEIGPGDAVPMTVRIAAPDAAGDYEAEIDLVHEYITWFGLRGGETVKVRFTVL